jgi:hypothetical protein
VTAPTVLVDIDGVLADFNPNFLRLLNTIEGGEPKGFPGGLAEPNVWQWFAPAGFSSKTIDAAWSYVKAMPNWWYSLRPYDGAIGFVCDLMEARDNGELNVYFVTSRPNQAVADATNQWLCSVGASRPNVIVVQGAGSKGLVAQAVGATAMLDDHGPNFEGTPDRCKCFLLARPWNEDDDRDHRITSLIDFLAAVRGPRVLPSFAPAA